MSTYERRTPVTDKAIPKGYKVEFCEIRGYDSPDKWYEAFGIAGVKLGEFGRKHEAIEACTKDAKPSKKSRFERI